MKSLNYYKISILGTLSIILVSASFAKSVDEIISSKKRAVLLITIYEKNNPKVRHEGTGFFVDGNGHFVTNQHVLETYIKDPANSPIQIQTEEGLEFTDIEILKCGNENKLDLCYGKINTDKKVYFFDPVNRSPTPSMNFAIVGHNGGYFSVKKGEVLKISKNVEDKYGVSITEQENRNTSMLELGKYDYANGFCKGDSGSPVFDIYSGDLLGVFTNCLSFKGGVKTKYAIDSKELYQFINSESKFNKFKIPVTHIYSKPNEKESSSEKGEEFEVERTSGKLQ
jgi:V8-like Glu-specific endopeptidase